MKLKKNMGTVDRGVRVLIAVVIALLFLAGKLTGVVAAILGIVAVIFVLTSLVSFCPLYTVIGLSTRKGD